MQQQTLLNALKGLHGWARGTRTWKVAKFVTLVSLVSIAIGVRGPVVNFLGNVPAYVADGFVEGTVGAGRLAYKSADAVASRYKEAWTQSAQQDPDSAPTISAAPTTPEVAVARGGLVQINGKFYRLVEETAQTETAPAMPLSQGR